MAPPLDYRDYERVEIGIDTAHGRHGEVSVEQCRHCGAYWLNYFHEKGGFTESGCWYRGVITKAQAEETTAAGALALLATLPWHLYGGSFYRSSGRRSDAPLNPKYV